MSYIYYACVIYVYHFISRISQDRSIYFTLKFGLRATGDLSSGVEGEAGGGVLSRFSAVAISCFLASEEPSFVIEILRLRFLCSLLFVDAVRASINISLSCSTIARNKKRLCNYNYYFIRCSNS